MSVLSKTFLYFILLAGGMWFFVLAAWIEIRNHCTANPVKLSPKSWLQYSTAGFILLPGTAVCFLLNHWEIGKMTFLNDSLRQLGQFTGIFLYAWTIGWASWASIELGHNFTHKIAIHDRQTICQSGPYGIVRHPLYLAQMTGSLSLAVMFQNVAFGILFLFIIYFAYQRAAKEEELFLECFGDAYRDYQKKVAMLIPGWKASNP